MDMCVGMWKDIERETETRRRKTCTTGTVVNLLKEKLISVTDARRERRASGTLEKEKEKVEVQMCVCVCV